MQKAIDAPASDGGIPYDPMIELLRGFPDNVVAISCRGEVTKADYDTVLLPRRGKDAPDERQGSAAL
jgi:hypothetical protein